MLEGFSETTTMDAGQSDQGAAVAAPPASLATIRALEAEVADLREAVFALSDAARRVVPHDLTALHVSLQSASNELGEAERLLRTTGQL